MKFDFHKLLDVIKVVAPFIPGGQVVAPFVEVISHAIGEAEKHGGTGPEKKARAVAIVKDAATVVQMTGKVHIDPNEVATVAGQAIDTTVGVVNIIEKTKVPVTPPA